MADSAKKMKKLAWIYFKSSSSMLNLRVGKSAKVKTPGSQCDVGIWHFKYASTHLQDATEPPEAKETDSWEQESDKQFAWNIIKT